MSSVKNIIFILVAVFIIGLGIEGYYYLQATKKFAILSNPLSKKSQSPNPSSDQTNQVTNSNLVNIGKFQAEEWAKKEGTVLLPGSRSVKGLAGYFKSSQNGEIVLVQNGKEVSIGLEAVVTVWSKEQDNFSPVIIFAGGNIFKNDEVVQSLKSGSLILAVGVKEEGARLKTSNLVVYK